jgi:tetratricopeptide (TPR) repeat protein
MIHVGKTIETAQGALEEGRLEDAERGALAVLEFDEGEPRALRLLGQVAQRRGESQRAADLFQRALKTRGAGKAPPRGPVPTPTLAELYVEQGHIDAAIRVYRELLAGAGGNEQAPQWRQRVAALEQGPSAEPEAEAEPAETEQRLREFLRQLDKSCQVRRLRQFLEDLEAGSGA